MFLFNMAVVLPMFIPIILMALALFIGLTIKSMREKRQIAEAQQTAQALGLSFTEKDNFGLSPQLKAFELFRHSRRRWGRKTQVTNILRGQVGDTEVYQFDYSYIVSTGKSAHRVSQTVFFANDKQWSLPDFRLQPEQWWHKVLAKLGAAEDINFTDNPDFSQHFHLTSKLEALAREKFGPELQQFLLSGPRIHLEGCNYYLIAYQPKKLLKGEAARLFFERCSQLTALLKGTEKQDLLDLTELKKDVEAQPIVLPEAQKRELD